MCTGAEVGLIVGGASTLLQVQQQQSAAKSQQRAYDIQAQREESALALRSEDRERERRRAIARQRALYAVSGVDVDVGSPTRLFETTAGEFGREEFADEYGTRQRADDLRFSGRATRSRANAASAGTLLDFGATTLRRG